MKIDEALLGLGTLERASSLVDVTGIQYDSRRVRPGDLFVAMRGGSVDGNTFIPLAVKCGATAVVTDLPAVWDTRRSIQVPVYLVANGRRALAHIAANVLGHPERKLKVGAVTGTNGKTTTAFLLEQMLRSVGRTCVLVGTIETHVGYEVRVSEHTTPEASDLLRIFADGVAMGASEAVMEMSSHALDQERVWGVPVDIGIFTNLTQDHLDYHGTLEAYAAAKAKLFSGVGTAPPRVAVVNADDAFGAELLAGGLATSQIMDYGISRGTYRAEAVSFGAGWTRFRMQTPSGGIEVSSSLTGRVNVYNLLAASCAALARGLSLRQVAEAARDLRQAPGRFQTIANNLGLTVVVDYAHTEDAIRNLIALARELIGNRRVITMFGCGGDRDRTKRPRMGRAAGEGSDLVVLTSDNPRSEDPVMIIEEALAGVRQTAVECVVEQDRARAIELAIRSAEHGDIVLIAGKGHEKVQILAHGTIPFDDVAVAAACLERLQGEG